MGKIYTCKDGQVIGHFPEPKDINKSFTTLVVTDSISTPMEVRKPPTRKPLDPKVR